MKNISIITCGPGMKEVKTLYGQASDWIQNILERYNVNVNVVKGFEMGDLDPSSDSAWIITGSAHSVYDDFDKIHSEFVAMSAGMPKVASKLRGVLRTQKKLLELIFKNNNLGF